MKAQINSAILVAVIAALIIIYMMFLPSEEREALLGEGEAEAEKEFKSVTLLSEHIGHIAPSTRIEDKTIPNVYLFETVNAETLAKFNPIYIRNGWFDKKDVTLRFSIKDLENVENVMLSFLATKRKGILKIELNNEPIFEYEITRLNVEPISIRKDLLKDANTLKFSVSSVGWKFWKTNEYALEDIKIVGDITDKSRQESRNIFTLSESEYKNLEKASLRFIPYCNNVDKVGKLDVYINNINIFSTVPVCDDVYKIEVPISILNAGENKVIFKTEKGSYTIEQIKIGLEGKPTQSLLYYFEINESLYDDVLKGERDVVLTMEFVDEERKKADLNINRHKMRLDQYEESFTKNINNWISKGTNFIEIKPITSLDIIELRIEALK